VRKKIEKPIKPKKPEKKLKKTNREKKPIKPIKILKKPTYSVWFYKPETEKTEPNPNRIRAKPKKPSQTRKTEPNRFEPVFVLK
jgi:hypothetical protein